MLEQCDELLRRTDCVEILPIPFLGIGHFLLTCVVPAVLFAVQITHVLAQGRGGEIGNIDLEGKS